MAERRKGLTWIDFVLLALALLGVYDLVFVQDFPKGPYAASTIVLASATVSSLFVLSGKDIYRWIFRYFVAFQLAMLFGNVSFAERIFEVPRWFELPVLLLIASMPVMISFTKSEKETAHKWLAFAMFLGLLVAMFSGSAGAGSTMIEWLQDKFDMTFDQAVVSTRVFRKAVHVSFYALMFFSMARSAWQARGRWSVSILAGLAWASGHAVFDETVQRYFSDRTGSIQDYFIDMSGMALAFVLSWLIWGRKKDS